MSEVLYFLQLLTLRSLFQKNADSLNKDWSDLDRMHRLVAESLWLDPNGSFPYFSMTSPLLKPAHHRQLLPLSCKPQSHIIMPLIHTVKLWLLRCGLAEQAGFYPATVSVHESKQVFDLKTYDLPGDWY